MIDRSRTIRILGVLLFVASLWAIGQAWATSARQRSYVECQAAWSQAYAESSEGRLAAATADREALDIMIITIFNATEPGQGRVAIEKYLTTRAAADRIRAENPLPPLPAEVCK